MNFFSGNSLWFLVAQSDLMTKLVLLSLLAASVICWTIIFYKIVMFRTKMRQLTELRVRLRTVNSLEQLTFIAQESAQGYAGHLVLEQVQEAKKVARRASILSEKEKALLDEQRFLTIDHMVYQENAHLHIISVNAAVSPLIGLFGTVWGLMHAFMSISELQSADIVTTAPGIAEALITTLAGLMVAIPMLIMFNHLQMRVAEIEHQLCRVSDRVSLLLQIFLGYEKEEHEVSNPSSQTSYSPHAS